MNIHWPDGLDTDSFLKTCWQRKPLVIRQAFPDFESPIDANELAGLACDADANSRFMEQIDDGEWRMCSGPFEETFFTELNHHQWSLLVSDVEKLLPDFRDWLQPFRFLPDWRIDDLMISYAPVGGSVGAHVDQYDVFLLQASGERQWQIETSARVGTQSSASSNISLLGDFNADETWHLRAGDMLYLPPGFAHHGIATEDPCMTWSIGFRAPSAEELLPSILNYINETPVSQTRFTDPGRAVTRSPGLIAESDAENLRTLLRDAINQDDATLDVWLGRFLTEDKSPPDEEQFDDTSTTDLLAALDQGQVFTVNSQRCAAYRCNESNPQQQVQLFLNGEIYRCSLGMAIGLCDRRLLQKNDLDTNAQDDLTTLTTLHNRHDIMLSDFHDQQ